MFAIIPPLLSVGVAVNGLNFLCGQKNWQKAQLILFLWLLGCLILSNAHIGIVITNVIAPPDVFPKWIYFDEIEAANLTRIVIPADNKDYFKNHTAYRMNFLSTLAMHWFSLLERRWDEEKAKHNWVCVVRPLCQHIWDTYDELVTLQKLGNYNEATGLLGNFSTCNRSALFDFSNRISTLLPILNEISVAQRYTRGREFGAANYFMAFKGLSVLRKQITLRLQGC
ncbi:hypothetical protein Fcan01_28688 [Folsomia candida]|uniref:Uncharacterized protein n=1 Tax=Folsomia candida TaxID=158441 RepID=A0A226CWY5_FOLCA|nr:hypothetical protein Fcan01_28688 [Folsomia candida]